jgi:gamma-glutamyl hercynylcysteine S-oxide synthase
MSLPERSHPRDFEAVVSRLEEVRDRTLLLVGDLDWPTLRRQHIPILSPIVWDLGHIGHFEELWIGQRLGGHPPLVAGFERLFDPGLNPRPTRGALPLPDEEDLFAYLERVRRQSLEVMRREPAEPELARNGMVWELVAQHEEQHQETILQALHVLEDPPYRPATRRELSDGGAATTSDMVLVPGGRFAMGWAGGGFAYDNELPAHTVEVAPFLIDRRPVSEEAYLAFIEEGGYRRRELWSEAGWHWVQEEEARAPLSWRSQGAGWRVRSMDRESPPRPGVPVCHVCWHEADAYARFVGKRLPTEAEWEKAALLDPGSGVSRPYPWGDEPPTPQRANIDQLVFGPGANGSPGGASALGVEQMVGDVWEWTASDFLPYPGFRAYPYPEYSEVFFGSEYKVLRGGSWATRPAVARGTFRNWDYPIRRQIFAGFRCARDAENG